MPKLVSRFPKYRRHKASGQALVTINGKDFYLGRWNSTASKAEYTRLIGEYVAHGRVIEDSPEEITVSEILIAYVRWAKSYYVASRELAYIKLAMRPVKEMYARTPATKFGPLALKAVRQRMVETGLSRSGINARVNRIKRVFRWAVENELIPPAVFQGLQAVRGLARGRTTAKETEPVRPVPESFVDALDGHVRPQVWAMIQLQRLTGMRPGEVITMQAHEIDTSGRIWIYKPAKHKNAHRGHGRKIYLGPRAQAVIRPWLKPDLQAYLFSPADVVEQHRLERHKARKTPLSCGNRPGRVRKQEPKRTPSDKYTVTTYRRAIERGCLAVGVPKWGPNRLRHNAATWLRKEFGLDVARVILGHRSPAVTEIYAEVDQQKAIEVMATAG